MRNVQPDVVSEDLGPQAIDAAADRRQKHQDVRRIRPRQSPSARQP